MKWKNIDSCMVYEYISKTVYQYKNLVCGFDLDHTLIKPKNDKNFSSNNDPTDWTYFHPSIPQKLRELSKNGYKIIIVTNQAGLQSGKTNLDVWKQKVEQFLKDLDVTITVLVSTEKDKYRKPNEYIWTRFIKVDPKLIEFCFFCGDAGGIKKSRKIGTTILKKDFSDSDYKFALNLGIKFIHRDDFVFGSYKLDKLIKIPTNKDITVDYSIDFTKIPIGITHKFEQSKNNSKEIIIMVGYPGSGKSYYCKKYIVPMNYIYINQDTLKTLKSCLTETQKLMEQNKNIVIDNTNPSIQVRENYIKLAKQYGYTVRCILFNTSKELSMHNNYYRNIVSGSSIIPSIAYNMYKSKFNQPTIEEGFVKIDKIEFSFDADELPSQYKKYMF